MFDDRSGTPRVYAQPLGTDFPAAVVGGLRARMAGRPPDDMARVTLLVNTTRMMRRILTLFAEGPAGFIPRMRLVTDLGVLLAGPEPPAARSALERRLQLAQLIAPAVERLPDFAPRTSVFALADSLAQLMDEMQAEGVDPAMIADLDVTDQSGHWVFAQKLIGIAHDYVSALGQGQDAEARQRHVVELLVRQWSPAPPGDPIILAGSTGSRGPTAMLMRAVARLPQGAVILPGFDSHLPADVWARMSDPLRYDDHAQFRLARFLQDLDIAPAEVAPWDEREPFDRDRNRVVSLALRPAPVTDAWLTEGARLPDIAHCMRGVTLVEASSQRVEALTIAMRLRMAAEMGQSAALITPDRMLGRQVAAALDRWDIVPDDSGGEPLHLTAPGRFLRHSADLLRHKLDAELLLTLLKHPLTQSGVSMPLHGLFTQRLELQLRKDRVPFPDGTRLLGLVDRAAEAHPDAAEMRAWGQWLGRAFSDLDDAGMRTLTDWLDRHRAVAELIAGGGKGASELWEKPAGHASLAAFGELEANAHHGGEISAADYAQLLSSVLSQIEVRDRDKPHPGLMIWGTLEARVEGADLVILGGLNDGTWPAAPGPDPWLNRSLRHKAGLRLPDRDIGLSAHDFQQAIAAREVWLTRSLRSDDAETVPSRWVNRMTSMIGGLQDGRGGDALDQMRSRGTEWLKRAAKLEKAVRRAPAGRAAPKPPVDARPRDFSVTEIRTLIRDPYAIYARHCLRLRPLDPLVQEPDAPIRGILIHDIMERFVNGVLTDASRLCAPFLMQVTDEVLDAQVPWPTARVMWRARMARVADWIVETERERMEIGCPAAMEKDAHGSLALPEIGGSIRARADRIDLDPSGAAILYDYKSGSPPTPAEQQLFDKQLLIEAAMIEEGAFTPLGPRRVADAAYIGLGANPKVQPAPLDEVTPAETLAGLKRLIAAYLRPDQHYLSRRMLKSERDAGDYDQLARHGEWEDVDDPAPTDLA
jgi:ATP-dependent helicase/nuclease subunit B